MATGGNSDKNKQAIKKIQALLNDFLKRHEELRTKAQKIFDELSKEADDEQIKDLKQKISKL